MQNIERRRNKDDNEYEAPEVDEFGNMVQSNLLKKYDEELSGPKTSSFRIGRRGEAILDGDDKVSGLGEKERKLAKLRKLQSLSNTAGNQLVSEYLTQEEVAFKKVKKVKKKKKKMLTADDLIPLDDGEVHHGSRNNIIEGNMMTDTQQAESSIKSLRQLMEEEEEDGGKMEVDDDSQRNSQSDDEGLNDDYELQEALARSRKAKLSKLRQPKIEDIKEILDATDAASSSSNRVNLSELLLPDNSSTNSQSDGLVVTLNTTDEFCRTLGDIPTYGLSGNRAEDDQPSHIAPAAKTAEEATSASGAWEEVGIEDTRVEITEKQSVPILDEEPDASIGVANALR